MKSNISYFLFLVLITITAASFSKVKTMVIQVNDDSGSPLYGAIVVILKDDRAIYDGATDRNGQFSFETDLDLIDRDRNDGPAR